MNETLLQKDKPEAQHLDRDDKETPPASANGQKKRRGSLPFKLLALIGVSSP